MVKPIVKDIEVSNPSKKAHQSGGGQLSTAILMNAIHFSA